jgi:predicted Ser/Thr protein kinase
VEGREGRVVGHEEVQAALYRILTNFVRAGRVNKLILLHGPNGSAKSSLVSSLMHGMEVYSRTDQGAIYRFNWVFPSTQSSKGSMGFGERKGSTSSAEGTESFAHLEGDDLDARIGCELKDSPLLLIPREERRAMLEEACQARSSEQTQGEGDFVLSDALLDGELCQKCRAIYQGLLAHYSGDFAKVLRHVQVERFYISRRYQSGAVTVEPQMSVDATLHQVTADKSPAHLPPALSNLALFEPYGPLVAGNRCIIEYADLLKRPLEAYKYLLGTVETGLVQLEPTLLQIDEVLIASSNEKHLNAFKEIPDFASFKGRIELIRVPYLRRVSVENAVYAQRVTRASVGKHVAPHSTWVAATWAVLTRLKKPIVDRYKGEVKEVIDDLEPIEKLQLYDQGQAPDRLGQGQAKELKKNIGALQHESDAYPNYEGRYGASAREIKTVLLNAAQRERYKCLTPQAVLEELELLVQDRSVYEFLQQEIVDGFHDHAQFVRVAESEYLDLLDEEIRDAMGLVSEQQYRELFKKYVSIVSAWVKNEKVQNKHTGAYEKPDEAVMMEMESVVMIAGEDRGNFRKGLISNIGAHRLENPDSSELDYTKIFPDLFKRLRDHHFGERRKALRRVRDNYLRVLTSEQASLLPKELKQIEEMLATMVKKYAYCEHCSRDAILFLMQKRYAT